MANHHQTISASWEEYAFLAISKTILPDDLVSMRRAYYAGAQSFLAVLLAPDGPNVDLTSDASELERIERLDALDFELQAFARAIDLGLA